MSKTIRVSDDYHAYLKAHNRDGETTEVTVTVRRSTGGPRPEDVAGIFSEEAAEKRAASRWALPELNQRSPGYEPGALTRLS